MFETSDLLYHSKIALRISGTRNTENRHNLSFQAPGQQENIAIFSSFSSNRKFHENRPIFQSRIFQQFMVLSNHPKLFPPWRPGYNSQQRHLGSETTRWRGTTCTRDLEKIDRWKHGKRPWWGHEKMAWPQMGWSQYPKHANSCVEWAGLGVHVSCDVNGFSLSMFSQVHLSQIQASCCLHFLLSGTIQSR